MNNLTVSFNERVKVALEYREKNTVWHKKYALEADVTLNKVWLKVIPYRSDGSSEWAIATIKVNSFGDIVHIPHL